MKNKTNTKYLIAIIGIIILIALLSIAVEMKDSNMEKQYNEELFKEIHKAWICWDGCYNMLEIIYQEVNESIKPFYDECVKKCDEIHFNFPYENISEYKNKKEVEK